MNRDALLLALAAMFLLAACSSTHEVSQGNPGRGADLFTELPCAGCHGVTARGQYGPTLAGTALTFAEVRQQVRDPRDKMPAFDRERVSDEELRHIYAWLTSLPRPGATTAPLSPAEATTQARNRRYPALDAATLTARMHALDELTLRVSGELISVTAKGRFTEVRLRLDDGNTRIDVIALYDTALADRPFPAGVGDQVTLYGVGADPLTRNGQTHPRLQILYISEK